VYEFTHTACVTNPISLPTQLISPIWIPLVNEVSKVWDSLNEPGTLLGCVISYFPLFQHYTDNFSHLLKSGNLLFTYPHFIISDWVILFFLGVSSDWYVNITHFRICVPPLQFMLGNFFWEFFYSYPMLISYVRIMHSTL
jgi:hypothetical protein